MKKHYSANTLHDIAMQLDSRPPYYTYGTSIWLRVMRLPSKSYVHMYV